MGRDRAGGIEISLSDCISDIVKVRRECCKCAKLGVEIKLCVLEPNMQQTSVLKQQQEDCFVGNSKKKSQIANIQLFLISLVTVTFSPPPSFSYHPPIFLLKIFHSILLPLSSMPYVLPSSTSHNMIKSSLVTPSCESCEQQWPTRQNVSCSTDLACILDEQLFSELIWGPCHWKEFLPCSINIATMVVSTRPAGDCAHKYFPTQVEGAHYSLKSLRHGQLLMERCVICHFHLCCSHLSIAFAPVNNSPLILEQELH